MLYPYFVDREPKLRGINSAPCIAWARVPGCPFLPASLSRTPSMHRISAPSLWKSSCLLCTDYPPRGPGSPLPLPLIRHRPQKSFSGLFCCKVFPKRGPSSLFLMNRYESLQLAQRWLACKWHSSAGCERIVLGME